MANKRSYARRGLLNKTILDEVSRNQQQKMSNPKWSAYYTFFFKYLSRILYSMYEWENLPETMDGRFIERTLMQDGICAFLDHDLFGFINTRATWGEPGIYGYPMDATLYSVNGAVSLAHVDVSIYSTNAVLCLNNSIGEGYIAIVPLYASRIADIIIAEGMNIDAQKTPVFFDGEAAQLEMLMAAYNMYAGGCPVIPTRTPDRKKEVDAGYKPLEALNLDVNFVASDLHQMVDNVLNEFFQTVGINSSPSQKRERLVAQETSLQLQRAVILQDESIACRKECADRFNSLHGTDIKVKPRFSAEESFALLQQGGVEPEAEEEDDEYDAT